MNEANFKLYSTLTNSSSILPTVYYQFIFHSTNWLDHIMKQKINPSLQKCIVDSWLTFKWTLLVTFSNEFMFQVFSSGRRETGGGFSRTGSSSLSLLPYFDMADLASSGPYIVSILKTSSFTPQCECSIAESLFLCVNIICNLHLK